MIGARLAAAVGCVAAALLLSVWLRPTERLADAAFSLERALPRSFGNWRLDPSIVPVSPSPDVQAQLDAIYDQIVARTYVNVRGDRIMLSVAYRGEQTDAFRAHRQEACYHAQGFTVRDLHHEDMQLLGRTIRVVRLHAVRGARSEPVTYWMTMGERIVWYRSERMAAQIAYGLRGLVVDGMLVRVSSLDADPAAAYLRQQAFLNELLASLGSSELQRRFVGREEAAVPGRDAVAARTPGA